MNEEHFDHARIPHSVSPWAKFSFRYRAPRSVIQRERDKKVKRESETERQREREREKERETEREKEGEREKDR